MKKKLIISIILITTILLVILVISILNNKDKLNEFINSDIYVISSNKKEEENWIQAKKEKIMDYNYNVYFYDIDDVLYEYNKETVNLKESLKNGIIFIEEIIGQAKEDERIGKIKSYSYMDGQGKMYIYENFSILKMNSTDGNNDVYIGKTNMKITEIMK